MNCRTLRTRQRLAHWPAFWALTLISILLSSSSTLAQAKLPHPDSSGSSERTSVSTLQSIILKRLGVLPDLRNNVQATGTSNIAVPSSGYGVLYSFGSIASDGATPQGRLTRDGAGNLYGTTYSGGAHSGGTVFKLDPTGTETLLYTFCSLSSCTDGEGPVAGVIEDSVGNLYGTTLGGGANNGGTVFKIDSIGHYSILYSFCAISGCPDGNDPLGALIQDGAGNLYGTTETGGANGGGTVFTVDSSGHETVLYSFCSLGGCTDGEEPLAGLFQDGAGNLYGTTVGGGTINGGTVFKLDTSLHESVLYSFCSLSSCADGVYPNATLVQDGAGNLYGTTIEGGTANGGTVFQVNTTNHETVYYSFCSAASCADGVYPESGLLLDAAGNLYGVTTQGGISNSMCTSGSCGVAFVISGINTETVLYSFCSLVSCTDGQDPLSALIKDSAGNLYGTTQGGGTHNTGTIFTLVSASAPNQSGKLLGPSSCHCSGSTGNITTTGAISVGEPIDTATGNMAYEITDYTTAGQNPLSLARYYNSRGNAGITTLAETLGVNWRSTFDRYLQINSSSQVTAERADGKQYIFTLVGSTWTPDSDVDITLTHSGSTWTITDHDDTLENYTTTGVGNEALLNSIQWRNGYTQTLSYNGSNQLTIVSDSYSRSLTLLYNTNGTLNTVTTPDSTTLTYGYTAGGTGLNLTSITYPTSPSSVLTYKYGESGAPPNALTGVVDENNNRFATWTYDGFSRGTNSQLGTGSTAPVTTVAYNSNGTTTVTNAFGVQDTYSYTTLQNVPKASQISRAATSTTAVATRNFSFDTNGYLATATDWNGNLTTYTNNVHGMPTKIVEPTRTTNIAYYTTPKVLVHLPKTISTVGLTSTFVYNTGNGDLLTRTDKDTTTQTVPYSTNGQTWIWTYTWNNFLLASVQNPRTDVTAITNYGYDSTGALTSITDALTNATNITSHTGGGRPLTIVDPNSVTTTLIYDARQRLTSSSVSTSAGARTTVYTVDPASELTKVKLPDNSYLAYGYDAAHRVNQVIDSLGNYITYALDALDDKTQINTYAAAGTSPERQHSATFDALGRILTDVGGMSQTTTFSNYDNNGNVQTITDPDLNPATQVFDALNRLTQVTDANSGITKFTYNTHDRTTKVTDPNTHNTSFVYDGSGNAIQQTSPDTGVTVYYYDGDRNLTSKTDALGVVTNNTYDKLDRVLTTTYPAQTALNVAYTYDQTGTGFGFGIGRLTSLTDAAGSLTRSYDERGNMLTEKRVNSSNTYTTTYTYDPASRIASIIYPDGSLVTNQYDVGGYFKQLIAKLVGGSNHTLASIGHLPFGPINAVMFGTGIGETWTFDNDYRPNNITDTVSSTTLQNVTYTYDPANNLKTISDAVNAANSQTVGYDVLNRINSAVSGTGGYGTLSWTYDKNGNLKTATAGSSTTTFTTATTSNQLASYKLGTATTTVSTNANGNITNIPPVGSSTGATFAYGNDNRLSSVTGTSPAANFLYDAFGRRFSKANSTTAILYFYGQDGSLLEEDNGGVYTDYLYADGRPMADLQPGTTPTADRINIVLADRLGTPQLVSNSSGATVWTNTYQPYGQGGIPISAIVNNLRLPGQNYDLETGFHYNLNRDYMPNIGRYLEADPVGLWGGSNSYRYANGGPLKFTDRRGLEPYVDPREGNAMQAAGLPRTWAATGENHATQGDVANALGNAGNYGALLGGLDLLAPPPYDAPAIYMVIGGACAKVTSWGLNNQPFKNVLDYLGGPLTDELPGAAAPIAGYLYGSFLDYLLQPSDINFTVTPEMIREMNGELDRYNQTMRLEEQQRSDRFDFPE